MKWIAQYLWDLLLLKYYIWKHTNYRKNFYCLKIWAIHITEKMKLWLLKANNIFVTLLDFSVTCSIFLVLSWFHCLDQLKVGSLSTLIVRVWSYFSPMKSIRFSAEIRLHSLCGFYLSHCNCVFPYLTIGEQEKLGIFNLK